MDLEKKLNDKVMGLLMKQKEFGEKESKMTRMQRDIVMFQQNKKAEIENE